MFIDRQDGSQCPIETRIVDVYEIRRSTPTRTHLLEGVTRAKRIAVVAAAAG